MRCNCATPSAHCNPRTGASKPKYSQSPARMWISLSRSGSVNRRHAYVEQENELEGVYHLSSSPSSSVSSYWRKNSGLRRANSNIETHSPAFRSPWGPASRRGRLSFSGPPASSGEALRAKTAASLVFGRKSSVDSNVPLSTNCGTMTNNTEEPAATTAAASSSDVHDVDDFDRSSLRRRSSKALRRLMVLIKTADQAKEEEKENLDDLDIKPQYPSTGSGSSFIAAKPGGAKTYHSQESREPRRSSLPFKLTQSSSQEDPSLEGSPEKSKTEFDNNVFPNEQWNTNGEIFSNSLWNASKTFSDSHWKANGKVSPHSQWNAKGKIPDSQCNGNGEISESQWSAKGKISDSQCNGYGEISESQWDAKGKTSDSKCNTYNKISNNKRNTNGKISDSRWNANGMISDSQQNPNEKVFDHQWDVNDKISDSQWNADWKISDSEWSANGKVSDIHWHVNGKISKSQWNSNENILDSHWNSNRKMSDSQCNTNDEISENRWNSKENASSSHCKANGVLPDSQWDADGEFSDSEWNANEKLSECHWNANRIPDSECSADDKISVDQWDTNEISDSQWNANKILDSRRNGDIKISNSHWNAYEKNPTDQWNANGKIPDNQRNDKTISDNQWNAKEKIPDSQWNANEIPDIQWKNNETSSDNQWNAKEKIPDSHWNANGKIPDNHWNANETISGNQRSVKEMIPDSQWNANGKPPDNHSANETISDNQWKAKEKNPDSQWNASGTNPDNQWNAETISDNEWNAKEKNPDSQWNANETISDNEWNAKEKNPDSQWNANGKISGSQWSANGKVFSSNQWNPWKSNGETDLDDWDDSVISFGNSVESTAGYLESMVRDESEHSSRQPPTLETQLASEVDYHGVEWGSQDDHVEERFSSTTFRCSPVSLENNNVAMSTCPFQNAFPPFENDILKVRDHHKDTQRSFSPFYDPNDPTSISENNVSSTDLAALSWSSVSLTSKDDVTKESGKDEFDMKDVWEKDDFSSIGNGGLLACFYQERTEEEYSDEDRLPDPFNDGQSYLRSVKESQGIQNSAKEDVAEDWWLKGEFQEESDETGKHQDWVTFEDDPLDLTTNETFPKTCADLMDPVCTCGAIYRRLKIEQGGKNSTVTPARGLLCHHNSMSNLIGTPKRKRSSTTDTAQPPSSTRRLIRTYSQRSRVAGQRVINKISRRLYPEEYDKLREPITSRAVLTMLDGPAMKNQHRTPSTDTLLAASLSNQARVPPRQDRQRGPSSSSEESCPEENGNVPCEARNSPAKPSVPETPPTTSPSSQRLGSVRYLKFPKLPLRRTTSFSNGKFQSPRSSPPSTVESSAPVSWSFSRNSSFWKALQALQLPSLTKTFRRGSSKAESTGSQMSSSTPRSPVFHTYVRGLSGLPVRVPASTCSTGTIGKGASPAALYWSRPTTPVKARMAPSSSSSSSYSQTPKAPRLPRRGMKSPT